MAPTQEARATSPQHLDLQDIDNYDEFFKDMVRQGHVPPTSKVYNIHQVFDGDWDYQGAWYTIATDARPTDLFWLWIDAEWGNMRIVEESPVAMYPWIVFLTEMTLLNYRLYGNCNDWMLLSAGTLNLERFA